MGVFRVMMSTSALFLALVLLAARVELSISLELKGSVTCLDCQDHHDNHISGFVLSLYTYICVFAIKHGR